jgi:hypothetical protein
VKFRIAIPLVLCLVSLALAEDSTRFLLPQPPADAQLTEIGGKSFYSGLIYLEVVADTTLLESLGFRNFEFQGRSVNSVRYHAFWPQAAAKDSVPVSVSGIEYDLTSNPPRTISPDLNPDEPEPTPAPESDGSGNE